MQMKAITEVLTRIYFQQSCIQFCIFRNLSFVVFGNKRCNLKERRHFHIFVIVRRMLKYILLTLTLRALITLMLGAVSTSETSVDIYQTTQRNILQGSHHHL
jgi:hypothetical protein